MTVGRSPGEVPSRPGGEDNVIIAFVSRSLAIARRRDTSLIRLCSGGEALREKYPSQASASRASAERAAASACFQWSYARLADESLTVTDVNQMLNRPRR